jgi:hypothetical protein
LDAIGDGAGHHVIVNINLALAHAGPPGASSCKSDLSSSKVWDFETTSIPATRRKHAQHRPEGID